MSEADGNQLTGVSHDGLCAIPAHFTLCSRLLWQFQSDQLIITDILEDLDQQLYLCVTDRERPTYETW